jgi:hypothetical protein
MLNFVCIAKYYLFYLICRFAFMTCYKLCSITKENADMYAVLFEQNKKILNNQCIELIAGQVMEMTINNKEKNRSQLTARLSEYTSGYQQVQYNI